MRAMIVRWIESRRAARRTAFAVAVLRKEAASQSRSGDRPTGKFLSALADMIEAVP